MSGNRLLDTNIIIALFLGEKNVLKKIGNHSIYVPSIGIGEFRFGAEKSKNIRSNHSQIDILINEVLIIPVSATTGVHYGIIKSKLKPKGQPILENEIWIAAISRENDLVLVSRDKHFSFVNDIHTEVW